MAELRHLDDMAKPARRRGAREGALACFLVGGVVLALGLPLFLGPWPAAAGCAIYLVAAGIALHHLPAFHPHARFGLANGSTLLRLVGAAAFGALAADDPALLAGGGGWVALGAALCLLALDGVDGWLARRQGLASRFGARFDMEVDALLILVLAVIAWRTGDAGVWVLGLGLVRYAFVLAGGLEPRLTRPLPPSFRRKTVCVLQVGVLTVLLSPAVAPPVSSGLALAAFGALIWSFGVDVRWLLGPPGEAAAR